MATYGETEDYTINIVGAAGIDVSDFIEISIYPNPTESDININLGELAKETSKIEVVDLTGKVVYISSVIKGQLNKLELSYLEKGVYHVIVTTQRGKIIKQIVKE